jgi:DNA-binding transcriptional regulator YdaS (Cro superfamily)
VVHTPAEAVNRVFQYALGRPPSPPERAAATAAITNPSGKISPEGLADLLWAVLVKPEFQLIY